LVKTIEFFDELHSERNLYSKLLRGYNIRLLAYISLKTHIPENKKYYFFLVFGYKTKT
jgi:hypothetical protein